MGQARSVGTAITLRNRSKNPRAPVCSATRASTMLPEIFQGVSALRPPTWRRRFPCAGACRIALLRADRATSHATSPSDEEAGCLSRAHRALPRPTKAAAELERLRASIDAVDRELLAAAERARAAGAGGRAASSGAAARRSTSRRASDGSSSALRRARTRDPSRRGHRAGLPRDHLGDALARGAAATSRYFGPEGTFTHQAAREQFGALARARRASPTIARGVRGGRARQAAELGVVPVENTTEGVVTQTLDALAELDVTICARGRAAHLARSCSRGAGGSRTCARVASHPQPLAQCRRWLERHLPGVERIETASTAVAAQRAAEDPGTGGDRERRSPAEVYGLARDRAARSRTAATTPRASS